MGKEKGSEGILGAKNTVVHNTTEYIFKNISSIVTDGTIGTAVNIGNKGDLSKLVDNK